MAEIQDFNVTDASNTARWPENMPFGNVNNAGRADEGILARWFADTNGSITASGSANAFAITSNRTIAALFNNLVMAFTANFTITGASTLNFNGLGAKAIKRYNGSDVAAGDIISGQPLVVIYKSSPDQWFMITAPAALTGNMFADFSENATPGNPAADTARLSAFDDATVTRLRYGDTAGNFTVLYPAATAAEMEAATAKRVVPPDLQHRHPGHPKAWGVGTGGGVLGANYNIASESRISVGVFDITLSTAMSTTGYCVSATLGVVGGSGTIEVSITSTTVFRITTRASVTGALTDLAHSYVVFGDI